jgi:hypothetical protein
MCAERIQENLDVVLSEGEDESLRDESIPALPGSVLLAERIERNRFLRRMAQSTFLGFVAVSSGTASVFGFLANPAAAASGPCCPSCCGPSPCCNTSCCNKVCCRSSPTYACKNNGSTCLGYAGTWSGPSCWSCVDMTNCLTITCCDCKTNNQTVCSNPSGPNRCICHQTVHGCGPEVAVGPIIRDASHVPVM